MHWYQDSCKDLAFVQWICTVHHRYTIVHHGPSTFNSSTALLCYSFCVLAFTLVQYKSMYLQSVCHLQTKHCSQNSIVLSLMYLEWNELLHINILSAWIIRPIPLFWTLLWVERGYLVSFDHMHTPQFCVRPKIMMIAVVFQTNSSMVMHIWWGLDAKTHGHQPWQKMSLCDGLHDERQRMERSRERGVEAQFRAAQPVRLHE